MPEMTGAQALARSLQAEGVDTIFALPGVQIMAAFDALYELQDDIRLIHTRHEQATTYMADGYAKATGKVGVALVVPGPGALNAAAGLGTAYASSSPVLLISGQIPSHSLGKERGELHEIEDQLDVFRPITKWAHRVTGVGEIPGVLHEAMRHLKTGRPRPVELEVPPDTLAATGEAEILEAEEYPRLSGDPAAIQQAARLLATARKPAIIAGGGTISSGAFAELIALADYIQAPVMTTQQAKGVIPENHELSIGTNYSLIGPAHRVIPESDVILAVGTRFVIPGLEFQANQQVIHLDIDPEEVGRNVSLAVGIQADAREGLAQLLEALRSTTASRSGERLYEIAEYKQAFKDEIWELAPEQITMVEALRATLDDDAILVSGVTNIAYWSNVAFPVLKPRTFLTSSYFGTLGFAFPTALGAKVARPERQVVALCGDGGFMYSPQEFSTAVRYGINVVAIVFNNEAYGASRWDQIHNYGARFIGTDLHNPDFVKLAESFGAIGMRTKPEGLGPTLADALTLERPVLLEVTLPIMMPPFNIVR